MRIVRQGYIKVNKKELEKVLDMCIKNYKKVEYNLNFSDITIDIHLSRDEEKRKFIVTLFEKYLTEGEIEQIISREIDYIIFEEE